MPARELLFVARGCTGNPENSNSPRGFSTLLFDAAGMPGTSCALLAQAGSRLELFRGTGRAASRGSRESEALEERERDKGWILRHAPHSIFPSPISSAFSRTSLPRLPTPHVYLPRRQVPQNRRLGRERLQALRRRRANVAHWRGSDRRREVNRAPKEDAKKEFERTFVARPVKFSAHPLSPRLSPHK